MQRLWIACTLIFLALVSFRPAYPQAASGTITGTVLDPSGAVVPKANVIITNVERAVDYKSVTTASGLYQAQFLPPGEYSATAEAQGFKKAVKTGLVLVVGQTMRVDFNLEVGASTQTVEVRGDVTQLLKPETSEVGQIITSRQVVDLPLNGRNFADLIPLNAGVTTGMQNAPNSGYNFNGNRTDQNMFLIEGVDNVDQMSNLMMRPSLEAIEEFQIQTGNFSAEFGRAAGGVVQVQLRSGTNAFHGTVFEFLRNDKLDANGFFANQVPPLAGETGAPKTPLKRNQFGFSVGGPIKRNKLFFFGDYQGTRQRKTESAIYSVPTMAERAGDFRQTLDAGVPIYRNALLGPDVYPGCDLENFTPEACQRIPTSALDTAAVKVAQFYPPPNLPGLFVPGTGTFNNFAANGATANSVDALDVKVDFRPWEADSFSVRYSYSDSNDVFPAAFGNGMVGPCINCGVVMDLLAGLPHNRIQNTGLTHIHTFTPTIVNEFRAGLVRQANAYGTSEGGKNLADEVGIANVNVSKYTTGLPMFLFDPAPSWTGTSAYEPFLYANTTYQFTDNLSYVKGKHRIRAGLDIRRRLFNNAGNAFGRGFYIFNPFFTGNAFADFLTGRPLVILQDLTTGATGIRNIEYGSYVQDDIKISPRLTLNLGMRYDLFPGYVEVNNRLSFLDLATGVARLAGKNGSPRTLRPTRKDNWGPRFGFAWTPWADGKTVVRGGYGISYFNAGYDGGLGNTINPPITQGFFLFNIGDTGDAAVRISDGLPIQLRPRPEDFDPNHPTGTWYVQDPHAGSPYTQFFSLGIQRALPGDMAFDVSYVGTRGLRLPGRREGNPAPPGPTTTLEERRIYHSTIPGVSTITLDENRYTSTYHSLQAKLQKRFSHGLQVFASYTWAKSIDNLSGSSVTGGGDSNPSGSAQNPFNVDADRGRSSFDITHRFVLSYNYDLPFGRGQHFGSNWNPVVNGFLGGWQINGIITLSTGLPFSVFASGATNCGCSAGDMRADRLGNGNLPTSQRTITGWFDKTAFTDPPGSGPNPGDPIGRYGNSGRNIIYGPGFANIDFSVFKKFRIHEKLELQFRAEFFNLFNHTNFFYPTSSQNATWTAGGLITKSHDPRIGQVALKLVF
jgi:outer membrane receptor protein involved in Fe transport